MRQGWLAMLGSLRLWPREICLPVPGGDGRYMVQVEDEDEYLSHVMVNAPITDVWVGKRPTALYHTDIQDRIYWDVDSPDPDDGLEQSRILAYRAEEEFGALPEALFSSNKGFHLHLEHDPIVASGPAYRDVLMEITQGWGAFPDPGPLQNGRSMPRAPYSLNRKSISRFGEPLYVVPVDLTLDLDEIIQSAREVRMRRIEIPKADGLADLLQPPCEAIDERRKARDASPMPDGDRERLVRAAITFVETSGHRVKGKKGGYGDGRRRILYQLYIPALANACPDRMEEAMEKCQVFVEKTGGAWFRYKAFCESTFRSCFRDGEVLLPMRIDRFLARNADLLLS